MFYFSKDIYRCIELFGNDYDVYFTVSGRNLQYSNTSHPRCAVMQSTNLLEVIHFGTFSGNLLLDVKSKDPELTLFNVVI